MKRHPWRFVASPTRSVSFVNACCSRLWTVDRDVLQDTDNTTRVGICVSGRDIENIPVFLVVLFIPARRDDFCRPGVLLGGGAPF